MSASHTLPILFGADVDRNTLVDQFFFRFRILCPRPPLLARLYWIEFVGAYDTCLLCLFSVVELALTIPTSTQDPE